MKLLAKRILAWSGNPTDLPGGTLSMWRTARKAA